MKRILLENLESNLMELQQAQVPGPSQQDVGGYPPISYLEKSIVEILFFNYS